MFMEIEWIVIFFSATKKLFLDPFSKQLFYNIATWTFFYIDWWDKQNQLEVKYCCIHIYLFIVIYVNIQNVSSIS